MQNVPNKILNELLHLLFFLSFQCFNLKHFMHGCTNRHVLDNLVKNCNDLLRISVIY